MSCRYILLIYFRAPNLIRILWYFKFPSSSLFYINPSTFCRKPKKKFFKSEKKERQSNATMFLTVSLHVFTKYVQSYFFKTNTISGGYLLRFYEKEYYAIQRLKNPPSPSRQKRKKKKSLSSQN